MMSSCYIIGKSNDTSIFTETALTACAHYRRDRWARSRGIRIVVGQNVATLTLTCITVHHVGYQKWQQQAIWIWPLRQSWFQTLELEKRAKKEVAQLHAEPQMQEQNDVFRSWSDAKLKRADTRISNWDKNSVLRLRFREVRAIPTTHFTEDHFWRWNTLLNGQKYMHDDGLPTSSCHRRRLIIRHSSCQTAVRRRFFCG